MLRMSLGQTKRLINSWEFFCKFTGVVRKGAGMTSFLELAMSGPEGKTELVSKRRQPAKLVERFAISAGCFSVTGHHPSPAIPHSDLLRETTAQRSSASSVGVQSAESSIKVSGSD
jgi:hypothetical protein